MTRPTQAGKTRLLFARLVQDTMPTSAFRLMKEGAVLHSWRLGLNAHRAVLWGLEGAGFYFRVCGAESFVRLLGLRYMILDSVPDNEIHLVDTSGRTLHRFIVEA